MVFVGIYFGGEFVVYGEAECVFFGGVLHDGGVVYGGVNVVFFC